MGLLVHPKLHAHADELRDPGCVVRDPGRRAMGDLFRRLKNEPKDTRHHQDGDAGGNGNGGFFVHKNPASDSSLTLIPLIFIKIIVASPQCADGAIH